MNPELLKGNNVELGVLEVSGDGLNAFRPIPGDIFETPGSLSELCGNSRLRWDSPTIKSENFDMCLGGKHVLRSHVREQGQD